MNPAALLTVITTDATHLTQARERASRNCKDQLWLAHIEWSVELWWLVLHCQLGRKSQWRIVESRTVCRYVYGGLFWLWVDVRIFSPLWVAPFPRQKILFTGLESGWVLVPVRLHVFILHQLLTTPSYCPDFPTNGLWVWATADSCSC